MTTFISPQALTVHDTVAATGVAAYAWLLILIPPGQRRPAPAAGPHLGQVGPPAGDPRVLVDFRGWRADRRPDVERPRGGAPLRPDAVYLDPRR